MPAESLTAEIILERIQREGVRRAAGALRKPPVSSRLLQELAERTEPATAQQFVAAYPLSPSHLLETLARTAQDPEVFPFLATNPRTPPHLLSEFSAHENPEVRTHVATHPQLAARELLALAQDSHEGVRRAVAANPALRLPHHATLVCDPRPSVRLRLAAHTTLPSQVALVLSADPSTIVRTHTIATAAATEEMLHGWAASDEEEVQLALCSRRDLPESARRILQLSPSASVRRSLRGHCPHEPADFLYLITQGDPEERAWCAAHSDLPPPLQRLLAQDLSPTVRSALAANPAINPDIAHYFVALAEEATCVALATNPAVSSDDVQALAATRNPAVITALAYRESLYDELIPFLLEYSREFRSHWAIQARPAVITDLALARRLVTDPLPCIRALAVTSFAAWRRADLYDFIADPAPAVRLAAARHAVAPDDLIARASADPVPEIAATAHAISTARAAAARLPARPATTLTRPLTPTTPLTPSPTPVALPAGRSQTPTRLPTALTPSLFNQLKRLFWQ